MQSSRPRQRRSAPGLRSPLAAATALLAMVVSARAQAVVVGPEQTPSPAGVFTADGDQNGSAVAFDGTNYFVVWQDTRGTALEDGQIFGARVSPSGTVLDAYGIPICALPGDQSSPSVAFDGTNYLAVWQDARSGNYDIYGARISPSGAVLDPDGFPISSAPGDQVSPSVAYDGSQFVVVWSDSRGGGNPQIFGARVDDSAAVLDPAGVALASTSAGALLTPSVAMLGTTGLLAWVEDDGPGINNILGAAHLDTSGSALAVGAPFTAASNASGDIFVPKVIASPGPQYMITWQLGSGAGSNPQVYATRVDATSVLDSTGIALTSGSGFHTNPTVCFDGTNYLVAWSDDRSGCGRSLYAARVTTAGADLDGAGIELVSLCSGRDQPVLSCQASSAYLSFSEYAGSNDDIAGVELTSTSPPAAPTTPFLVSTAAAGQSFPALAYSPQGSFLLWQQYVGVLPDYSVPSYDTYGSPISTSGALLDQSDTGFFPTNWDQYQSFPEVAFGGGEWLVTQDSSAGTSTDAIQAFRVALDGGSIDPAAFDVERDTTGVYAQDVAFGGNTFLVAYSVCPNSEAYAFQCGAPNGFDIRARTVALDGTVGPKLAISQAPGDQVHARVVARRDDFLVVWEDGRNSASAPDIYGARVLFDGGVLDPNGILIAQNVAPERSPRVASSGTDALVVWSDQPDAGIASIHAAHVDGDGGVTPVASAIRVVSGADAPAVASLGADWFVVWQERGDAGWSRVMGARLGAGDSLGPITTISSGAGDSFSPVIAGDGAGQFSVAYERYDADPGVQDGRVFVREVTAKPSGATCVESQECADGSCLGGFCVAGTSSGSSGSSGTGTSGTGGISLQIGCACGSGDGAAPVWLGIALLAWLARRPRSI